MRTAGILLLVAAAASAADFYSGQAARAVIGQPSFSARETGVAAHALSISHGKLSAAEASKVLTFDLNRPTGTQHCPVCGFAQISTASQIVSHDSARFATFGHIVAAVDTTGNRVLIWRNTRGTGAQPDVVLGRDRNSPLGANTIVSPVSVAYDGHRLFVGDAALHRVLVWNSLPLTDGEPADAVLGQPDFTTTGEAASPTSASLSTPAALASDGTSLYVADSDNRRILVFTPGDLPLSAEAVVNSASLLSQPFAPGTLVTIRAKGVTQESESAPPSAADPLPRSLGQVQVSLNGVELPLLSVSPEEIQTQLPYDLGAATSGSLIVRGATVTNAVAIDFAASSPGIFAVGEREPRGGLLLHVNDVHESQMAPTQGAPVTDENPAAAGETLTVWASGLGTVNSDDAIEGVPFSGSEDRVASPVTAVVNGQVMTAMAARLPAGAIGVYEVTIVLPQPLVSSDGVRLQLFQNAVPSNTVTIPVKP